MQKKNIRKMQFMPLEPPPPPLRSESIFMDSPPGNLVGYLCRWRPSRCRCSRPSSSRRRRPRWRSWRSDWSATTTRSPTRTTGTTTATRCSTRTSLYLSLSGYRSAVAALISLLVCFCRLKMYAFL